MLTIEIETVHCSVGQTINSTLSFSSMEKAIPLAKQTIVNLVNSGSQIPKWILTEFKAKGSFNDKSGVRVVTETEDPEQFKASVQSLSIGDGGDEEVLLGE